MGRWYDLFNSVQWRGNISDSRGKAGVKAENFDAPANLLSQGYTDFYLNCNYGVPMWTAELLCVFKKKLPLRLHIAAPHEEQCAHWKEGHRKRYMTIHEQADSVTFVSSTHDPDSYRCADEYMAEQSDFILVYDTQNTGLYMVDYAADIGVQVQYI